MPSQWKCQSSGIDRARENGNIFPAGIALSTSLSFAEQEVPPLMPTE